MEVFRHHLYEYQKGLRNLILHTTCAGNRGEIERLLLKHGIASQIYPLRNGHINVFFGADACVEVIRTIGKSSLNAYTAEEDFILGIMLGYDRLLQCRRYQRMRHHKAEKRSETETVGASRVPTSRLVEEIPVGLERDSSETDRVA